MLVLSRYESESIHIGDDVVVQVVRIKGGRVRIGIEAPRSISIRRAEVEPKDFVQPMPRETREIDLPQVRT